MAGAHTPTDVFDTPAAQPLRALLQPLRFAARDDFAGIGRLKRFGATVRGAIARAREAGAPDSAALRRLEDEAGRFDALGPQEQRDAVARIAAALGALLPLPDDLAALARKARIKGDPEAPHADAGKPVAAVEGRSLGRSPAETSVPAAPSSGANAGKPVTAAQERSVGRSSPEPLSHAAPSRGLLATRLDQIRGLHAAPRGQLEERGYLTVEQALSFWPKAYQDRTHVRRIADLRPGEDGIAIATVSHVRIQRMRSGKPILKVGVQDPSGALELVFFNPAPWRMKQFTAGDSLLCSGKVTEGFGARRQMTQPEVEKLAAGDSANFGRIVPVYAGPADYQHPALRKLMKRLCDEFAPAAVDDLPAEVRARRELVGAATALREAHFPAAGTDPAMAADRATPAFRRLIFEELFFLQLALAQRRRGVRSEPGIAFDVRPERLAEVERLLPFELTGSQRKVLGEIARDMARPEPMNRLLQGDVGSGKTAVAFAAMMLAVRSGYQAAIMAPTEILAEQHARTLRRWLDGQGVEVALVAARARGKEQKASREAVASGRARIAVGTHALIEEGVELDRLGLVVVDEQHRFGVLQRAKLMQKGQRPDVLVMTATPIPRTLALAFYGDLDQSKITELPPGRTPVETRVFGDSQRKKAYEAVRRELEQGRQAYVVYPLIEESEKSDLADATTGAADLTKLFAPHPVALLHGKMKAAEKEEVMARFRAGEIAVLVATTVIEVGVDVPNATVMVVEHAERFGLSQLHQLRGRVGRGAAKSHCVLIAHFARAGDDARERLQAMVRTQDGFEIARADLKLRGPGDLLGTRQSGQKLLEIADLYRDEAILEEAREDAFAVVAADPGLTRPEHAAAAEALTLRWAEKLSLARVG
ncbi:MAG TPA: ATP-dependent DNA helicase RecG [Anaeromyxobacteraceae bacterium]|nr:ATP-dependent DNA helicase RecG [Anaeromyxobacteraceae bacterium]